MSTTTAQVTEREARAVAEAARETEWAEPSFVRELFLGRFRLDLIHPHPAAGSRGGSARAKPFLDEAATRSCERVDPEQIDRTGEIPRGACRSCARWARSASRSRASTAGSGCRSASYNRAMAMVTSDGRLARRAAVGAPVHRRAAAAQAVRHRGAEEEVLPAAREGRDLRVRAHRAGRRLRPGEHARDGRRRPRTAAHYILNGEKLWCTNGTRAELFVVMARTPDARTASSGSRSPRSSSRRAGRASRSCTAAASWASRRSRTASSASTTCGCRARTSSGARGRDSSSRSSR